VFPTSVEAIINRLNGIKPVEYAASRNYANGAITYLSPYISRGVISTRMVYEHIKTLGNTWEQSEKLIQELTWRDYWQLVWIAKGALIETDLKNTQTQVSNHKIPEAVVKASTGILAVDEALKNLYKTGYMHNHMRMYVASICCNIAQCHWLQPAKWMYANLLDGDIASNHLSWQWVAGAFSNKKYYANQNNINKFFNGTQKNTFLDVEYDEFEALKKPKVLEKVVPFNLQLALNNYNHPTLNKNKTTLIYNYYNLDAYWHKETDAQRILLLEPSIFKKHPVEQKCIDFALSLSKNITDIKIFVGEFDELFTQLSFDKIIFKEHPLNKHYKGKEETRDWLSSITGYFPSFFAFWKKCKKELKW